MCSLVLFILSILVPEYQDYETKTSKDGLKLQITRKPYTKYTFLKTSLISFLTQQDICAHIHVHTLHAHTYTHTHITLSVDNHLK